MQIFHPCKSPLYANHLPYVPKPQHLRCAESDDSDLGTLKHKHLTQDIATVGDGKSSPCKWARSLTACQILLPPPPPLFPCYLQASFQVVMTIWSKYFDVSGMIKPRLALHRTLRQLGFPISADECIVEPGCARLGVLRSLVLSGRLWRRVFRGQLNLGRRWQLPGEL